MVFPRLAFNSATLAVLLAAHAGLAQEIDTARALGALRDAATACSTDAGALWRRSLCGPIALVDRQTRLVFANDTVAGRRFVPYGQTYLTSLPPQQFIANTSFAWGNREWTMVALPLPADRYSRIALVMHEVFHREQATLGLRDQDALNNQLDQRGGRTWMRLEYRALADALEALNEPPAQADQLRQHVSDALLFRAMRRKIYPGSDSLEIRLEIQEGLPEYTGHRLALDMTRAGVSRAANFVRDYEQTETFVRAFAYGTGPALGLLLDRFAPDWRSSVTAQRDLGGMLANAIDFRAPAEIVAAARTAALAYGWEEVDRSEQARDSARAPTMKRYRALLVDGPVITTHQSRDSLSWGYDPTALVGMDLQSTVYPSGVFEAGWGKLTVDSGGVLVWNDFSTIRAGGPKSEIGPASRQATGDGWTLVLKPGWSFAPDPTRGGSWVVMRER